MQFVEECFAGVVLDGSRLRDVVPLEEVEANADAEEAREVTQRGQARLGLPALGFAARRRDLAERLLIVFVLPVAERLQEASVDLALAFAHLVLHQDLSHQHAQPGRL